MARHHDQTDIGLRGVPVARHHEALEIAETRGRRLLPIDQVFQETI